MPIPANDPYRCSNCSGLLVSGEKQICSICLRRRRESQEDEIFALRKRVEELEMELEQVRELLGRFQVIGEGISDGCRAFIPKNRVL